jgi:hypothetical protein
LKNKLKSRENYGKRLFSTYESTLLGYDEMIKKLWSIIDSKNTDDKERIKAITLITQYYKERMELIKSEPDLLSNKQYMERLQNVIINRMLLIN